MTFHCPLPDRHDFVILGTEHHRRTVMGGSLVIRDQRGRHPVYCADEIGHKIGLGVKIDLAWRSDLFDTTVAHYHDPVAQCHGFALIVRDIDRRNPKRAQQGINFDTQMVSQ